MMWGYWNGGAGWGIGMMLVMGVFWVIVVFGLVSFVRHGVRGGGRFHGGGHFHGAEWTQRDDPLEIVKVRYARGEITKEEFEQLRRDLTGRD